MNQTNRKSKKCAAPGSYTVGRHAIKKRVNDWILEILKNIKRKTRMFSDTSQGRALILESGACQTVNAILSQFNSGATHFRIPEENIIIPNPDAKVLEEITANYKNLQLFQKTSHEYFEELNKTDSSKGDSFDLIWLDYCGTLNSRAGRRRKEERATRRIEAEEIIKKKERI